MNFLTGFCTDIAPIIRLIKFGVLPLLYIGIGIILVILIIIDIAKAVVASDEKEVKGYQKAAIRRVIYGVVIFFVVTAVNLVFNVLGRSGATTEADENDWFDCWSTTCKTDETWDSTKNKCVK